MADEDTQSEAERRPASRRSLLAAGLSGLAGLVLGALGRPEAVVEAAAGDTLILGNTANNAGASNTSLTTNSPGTALLVTQNGSGTALRGSAVGAGSIAGFFTANNGTGVSGITGTGSTYGVYGGNNGAASTGGAIRAAGGNNHGLVATTASNAKYALSATNTAATRGPGAAIMAAGGQNDGISVTTSHGLAAAVRGTNNGAYAGGMGGPVGVFGTATKDQGIGVVGQAPTGVGVAGSSDTGSGVEGYSIGGVGVSGSSDTGPGVSGTSNSGPGVSGMGGSGYGVQAGSQDGVALYANADVGYGVYCASGGSYALYGDGDCVITGNLSVTGTVDKAGGTFRVDHPMDPSGKYLQHSFVESPDMKNVYDGTARLDAAGEATVELPAYFDALNRDTRIQLTPVGSYGPLYVKAGVVKGRFTIAGGAPRQEVFWQVTGVRRDPWAEAHPVKVELAKTGAARGRYLHPELYGEPASKAISATQRAKARPPKPTS